MPSMAEITLRLRIEELEEEVRQLRELLVPEDVHIQPEWKLSRSQSILFRALTSRRLCTFEYLHKALYPVRADDPPEIQTIKVIVFFMRKKLDPFGVIIRSHWGQGFSLEGRERFIAQSEVA